MSKDAIPGEVPVVTGGLSPSTYNSEANTIGPVLTTSASGANAGYVVLWNQSVWSSDSSYIDSRMIAYVYFWYIMLKKGQKKVLMLKQDQLNHIFILRILRLCLLLI